MPRQHSAIFCFEWHPIDPRTLYSHNLSGAQNFLLSSAFLENRNDAISLIGALFLKCYEKTRSHYQ